MTYEITAALSNALFGICIGLTPYADCQNEIYGWQKPLSEPGYYITADKLNSLYAVCRNIQPATVCQKRVQTWLEQFVDQGT